jgi:hypothetical protein
MLIVCIAVDRLHRIDCRSRELRAGAGDLRAQAPSRASRRPLAIQRLAGGKKLR